MAISGGATIRLVFCLQCLVLACSAASVKYSSGPGNVKGDVVVLDVTSLRFQGNHPYLPAYTNPSQCETACTTLPGCNAWTFCNSTQGCGSGCKEYINTHPRVTLPPGELPYSRSPTWQLPITGFGPFGPTWACKVERYDYATSQPIYTDLWPFGLCTLKKVQQPDSPQYWSKDPREGWVSGTISTPSSCSSVTPAACDGCLKSRNSPACLACARSPQVLGRNPVMILEQLPAAGMGCVKCYSDSVDPGKCAACILKDTACKPCPADTYPTGDVDQCISCANRHGPARYHACQTCSTVTPYSQQKVSQCLGCVDRTFKAACPVNTTAESRNYTCTEMYKSVESCRLCATAAADFSSCESCMVKTPYSQGCGECAQLKGSTEQNQCYSCIATNKVVGSGCADCVSGSYFTDAQFKKNCLSCLADSRISFSSKTWCVGCQNWYTSQAGRVKCAQCLVQNPVDVHPCTQL